MESQTFNESDLNFCFFFVDFPSLLKKNFIRKREELRTFQFVQKVLIFFKNMKIATISPAKNQKCTRPFCNYALTPDHSNCDVIVNSGTVVSFRTSIFELLYTRYELRISMGKAKYLQSLYFHDKATT